MLKPSPLDPVRRMRLLPRHTCDHPPRCFLEHPATTFRTTSRLTRLQSPALRNYFSAESKSFAETIDGVGEGESVRRTPQPTPEPQRSSWLARRGVSLFHWQRPRDVHATSIRPRSCSLYPEEKRPACLAGSARAFFAQCFSCPLDCFRRKPRSIFSGNRHKQAPLLFELHRQRGWGNSDSTFFPTHLERNSRLYPRFASNILWNHQSAGVINGCFHGILITIY